MTADALAIWVVYDHPSDYPDCFVVRCQYAQRDGTIRCDPEVHSFNKLESARAWCAQKGLIRVERFPDDDPVIVESWL